VAVSLRQRRSRLSDDAGDYKGHHYNRDEDGDNNILYLILILLILLVLNIGTPRRADTLWVFIGGPLVKYVYLNVLYKN